MFLNLVKESRRKRINLFKFNNDEHTNIMQCRQCELRIESTDWTEQHIKFPMSAIETKIRSSKINCAELIRSICKFKFV